MDSLLIWLFLDHNF